MEKANTAVGFALKKMKELKTGITGYKPCIILNLNNRYTYNARMYVCKYIYTYIYVYMYMYIIIHFDHVSV